MMEEILGFLAKQRQILLYSATFPLSVQKFMVYFSHILLPTCLIILLLAEKQIIIICSTTYITTPIFTYFVDCTLAETL